MTPFQQTPTDSLGSHQREGSKEPVQGETAAFVDDVRRNTLTRQKDFRGSFFTNNDDLQPYDSLLPSSLHRDCDKVEKDTVAFNAMIDTNSGLGGVPAELFQGTTAWSSPQNTTKPLQRQEEPFLSALELHLRQRNKSTRQTAASSILQYQSSQKIIPALPALTVTSADAGEMQQRVNETQAAWLQLQQLQDHANSLAAAAAKELLPKFPHQEHHPVSKQHNVQFHRHTTSLAPWPDNACTAANDNRANSLAAEAAAKELLGKFRDPEYRPVSKHEEMELHQHTTTPAPRQDNAFTSANDITGSRNSGIQFPLPIDRFPHDTQLGRGSAERTRNNYSPTFISLQAVAPAAKLLSLCNTQQPSGRPIVCSSVTVTEPAAALLAQCTAQQPSEMKKPLPHCSASSTTSNTIAKEKEKPKRNLSAYNFFFREERQRLLDELAREQKPRPVEKEPKMSDNPRGPNSRKAPHHMIGFQSMGKVIGARWKSLSKIERDKYKKLAAQDKERYEKDKAEMKREAEIELTKKRERQELDLDPETKRLYLENDWKRSAF